MSDQAQLVYIKLILMAAETYNKIPKNDIVLREALRSRLELKDFQKCLAEIKGNFYKFKENKHFRYFEEFDTKTNYIANREKLSKSPAIAKAAVYLEKEKDIDKEKEKDKIPVLVFNKLWERYPNKDGKKAALRRFKASVKTKQDVKNINKALDNYLKSEKVKKGYIKNGSTWFNNWEDWVDNKDPGERLMPGTNVPAKYFKEG